jgi:hypothetical protein
MTVQSPDDAERHRLRVLVGDLRRQVHELQAQLNAERAHVRHLEATVARRRWWRP